MNYQRLRDAVEAVEENNRINSGSWNDWENGEEILDTYELVDWSSGSYDREIVAILNRAIVTNGLSLYSDCEAAEIAEYGQAFSGSWYAKFATI